MEQEIQKPQALQKSNSTPWHTPKLRVVEIEQTLGGPPGSADGGALES